MRSGAAEARVGVGSAESGSRSADAALVARSLRVRRDRWRQRSELRQLTPLIPGAAATAVGAGWVDYAIERVQLTETGAAVVLLARPDRTPGLVFKMPMLAEALAGLDDETRTLARLHGDRRLGGWRRLLPCPRASGSLRGRRFRVDSTLAGRPVLGRPADTRTLGGHLDAAAEAIHDLHRLTAGCVTADDALVESWIDGHVRELTAGAGRLPGGAARLQRVQQELHDAVEGCTFSVGAIHGDYWLGNVLFSRAQLTGIVDWDAAGTAELPVVDILHLLLFARCLASGRGFGDVICQQLVRPDWSARERRLLARYAGSESLSDRHALLLWWLRYAARHRRQAPDGGGVEELLWERRNVRRILEAA